MFYNYRWIILPSTMALINIMRKESPHHATHLARPPHKQHVRQNDNEPIYNVRRWRNTAPAARTIGNDFGNISGKNSGNKIGNNLIHTLLPLTPAGSRKIALLSYSTECRNQNPGKNGNNSGNDSPTYRPIQQPSTSPHLNSRSQVSWQPARAQIIADWVPIDCRAPASGHRPRFQLPLCHYLHISA